MSPVGALLVDVAEEVGGRVVGGSTLVTSVCHDSRQVRPGALFACVPGERVDGHDFATAANDREAAALLVERRLDIDLPQLIVSDTRRLMGPAAAAVYGHPERDVTVVGVTGTNGKTTVTHMLGSMLSRLGESVEVLGTLSGARTTPEAPELFAKLAQLRGKAVRYLAMEVSSHALELHRVNGMRFEVAAFTNLSRDHLDFHPSMAAYFEAKARLFEDDRAREAVINADDPHGRLLLDRVPGSHPYSLDDAVDLALEGPISRFVWQGRPVTLQLSGRHNVSNAVCAATILQVLDFGADDVADALGAIDPVPGRMEWISIGQPFRVVVDYSHTPDSLRAALAACRTATADGAKLHLVFGCGGDRDREKRPLMGAVAAADADHVIVTSDNPRSEDPQAIITQILGGMPSGSAPTVVPDRQEAIDTAIAAAQAGDVVLIAGKGHETTQTIGDQVLEFDDRSAAASALAKVRW